MAIRTSSRTEIDRLLGDLASDRQARREAAIARLTVIGARAVERVRALAEDPGAASEARASAFRTLEGIGDPRALGPALGALLDPEESVAIAAIGVARAFLKTPRGMTAVDRLTDIATDKQAAVPRRLAALDALRSLEPTTFEPLVAALRADSSVEIAKAVNKTRPQPHAASYVVEVVEGRLEPEVGSLKRALGRLPAGFSLPLLQRLIERLRDCERRERSAARAEWTAARASAHAALARGGSRLALYDLRETLESAAAPLPVEFLTALAAIGDQSCLAAIATAYARTSGEPRDWWHRHLVDAFRTIVARERVTRRHQAARKIKARWPEAFEALWP